MKYSVVIPTRNAWPYIKYAVDSVLSNCYTDFELIISLNSDDSKTEEYLKTLVDNRLIIVRPDSPLSMSENYEFGVSHARGEWIILIGSDDALTSTFFQDADLHMEKFCDSKVITWNRAYFFWPNSPEKYFGQSVDYVSSNLTWIRNPFFELIKALSGAKSMFNLPQLYTGSLVHRDVIARVKSKTEGIFFLGLIPDVYSSVAILLNVDSYLEIDKPLSWIGTSGQSMGIGNRIYGDGEDSDLSGSKCIHYSVDISLHQLKLHSIYLLESLKTYSQGRFKLKNSLVSIAYLGAWNELRASKNLDSSKFDLLKSNLRREKIGLARKTLLFKIYSRALSDTVKLYRFQNKVTRFIKRRWPGNSYMRICLDSTHGLVNIQEANMILGKFGNVARQRNRK